MKLMFYIALALLFILFAGRPEISFNPFYIRINGWLHMLGWLLIIIGIAFLQEDSHRIGYDECQEDIVEYLKDKEE